MTFSLRSEVKFFFSKFQEHIVRNMFIVALGIFEARSTNLNKVKDKLANILHNQETTKPESNYQRLIRFFRLESEEKEELIISLLHISFYILGQKMGKAKYLTLDGTSWEYGTKKIHLLTLAVVINGVSVPIWWEELDKKGTSNFEERYRVIEKAFKLYNLKGLVLLADREYIGDKWFKYLKNKGLEFVIRLKKRVYKEYVDEQRQDDSGCFIHQKWRYIGLENKAALKKFRNVGVSKQIEILGEKYTFVVFKNPKAGAEEPLIYFLSTLKDKKKIVKAYPIRWTIETCFKHLKSNGFELEALNFKDDKKIKLMMAIVVFLYALCIEQGLLQYQTSKKSDWKKFSNQSVTLAVSVFRKGLSYLETKFKDLVTFIDFLTQLIWRKNSTFWTHV